MSTVGLTPKDNELRMQVGFRLSHTVEHQLYVASEDGKWVCPMVALKELLALVRADEREACANVCENFSKNVSELSYPFNGETSETKFVNSISSIVAKTFAESIRSRGEQ